MEKSKNRAFPTTPEECVAQLPEIKFDPSQTNRTDPLQRAEMRHCLLAMVELSHVTESALVRQAVRNALGRLPEVGE